MTPAAALIKPSRSTSSGVPLIDTISSSFFHRDRRAAGFGQLAGRDRERDRTGQARELMARRDVRAGVPVRHRPCDRRAKRVEQEL